MSKVTLNIPNIKKRLHNNITKKFSSFLYDNEDRVFTPRTIVDRENFKAYVLEEDNTSPKWVFFENEINFLTEE